MWGALSRRLARWKAASRQLHASQLNRQQTLLCRASCWGAARGTTFPAEALPGLLGSSGSSRCAKTRGSRPASRAGRQCSGGCTASRASEESVPCPSGRPCGGRQLRSGRRLAREPVASPPLVTRVRGFARRRPLGGSFTVRERGPPTVGRRPSGGGGLPRPSTVTWLILPVVICLSQRLSHACLSINASIL